MWGPPVAHSCQYPIINYLANNTIGTSFTKEADLQCPECPKKFKQKGNLNEHFQGVHNNEKNEKCPNCKAAFKSKGRLSAHVRNVHSGIKYPCEFCEIKFTTKRSLNKHQMIICKVKNAEEVEIKEEVLEVEKQDKNPVKEKIEIKQEVLDRYEKDIKKEKI